MGELENDFADMFSEFYFSFFSSSSSSVNLLADIQKRFPEEYNSIKEFTRDPKAMEKLIDKLPPEKQGILLKILFKAGKFGSEMANLFESSEEQKRNLSKELNIFAEELRKTIGGNKK